jgi:hypothetical protein
VPLGQIDTEYKSTSGQSADALLARQNRCTMMITCEGANTSSCLYQPSPAIPQCSQRRWIKTYTTHTNCTTDHISHPSKRKKTSIYHDHLKRNSFAICNPNVLVRKYVATQDVTIPARALTPFVVKGSVECILRCIHYVSFISSDNTGFGVSCTRGSKMIPARFPLKSGLRSTCRCL